VTGFSRTAAILSAMLLGALVPQAHGLSGFIRWLVMAMLFLVFLQIRLSRQALHRQHAILFAANILIGFAAWGVGWLVGDRDVALAAFFCGITPTAIAAPVIVSFLGGRVEFVVAAFVISNVGIAALLPLLLPVVLGRPTPDAFLQVAASVGRLRNFSFGLWVVAIFLITSNASDFLRRQADTPLRVLLQIAGVSLLVCVSSFALGRLIGGRQFAREASQSLGQKNTTFTIYLALAYASPLVALGPTFYVVWHNLWNSWQLHRAGRRPPGGSP
jgi:BASS family bile acid:Na+ symporter